MSEAISEELMPDGLQDKESEQFGKMILQQLHDINHCFPLPIIENGTWSETSSKEMTASLLNLYNSGDLTARSVVAAAGSLLAVSCQVVKATGKVGDNSTDEELFREILKQCFTKEQRYPELGRAFKNFFTTSQGWVSGLEKTKKSRSPKHLPQPTFYESRSCGTAISDGRDGRDWKDIEGVIAMLHAPKKSAMQTRFEPSSLLLQWWGVPAGAQLEMLQSELHNLEFDALVTYFVCLSWAIEEFQVTTSLDSIIEAIGRGTDARRSTQAREMWRSKVWRWMLVFDSLSVIGGRSGTWKEPRSGDNKREKIDSQKLYSRDALLKIMGTRDTEQGTFDKNIPPKEISFAAGPWVNQFRGNREILSEFGDVRAIAKIPRGKPSGAWAACIGFALQQKWREQAATAPVTRITRKEDDKKVALQKFRPFTRRVLLAQLWRSDVDPEEILKSDHPERAKEYWGTAIELLQKNGIVGVYQEIEPLTVTGYGWQDAWLDQPLDIRPTGANWKHAIEISDSAAAARKRTRKKTVTPK